MDRDGVLIENRPEYVREWGHVEVFPQALEASLRLTEAGFPLVVVTNQSAIGRGILTLDETTAMNERILDLFRAEGVVFEGAYICPHGPDDDCDCRKPLPGMLVRGALEHGLDLNRSYMVGDAVTDMQAAEAAGAKGIMVLTGRGQEQAALLDSQGSSQWPIVQDLSAAVDLILGAVKERG